MVILQLKEQPPIIQAIFAGVVEEVKMLIEYKQDVNCLDCEKRTPLHAAAYKGDVAISSLLLQNGARVNAKDSKWITPLHRACSVHATDTLSLLLTFKADVSARDKFWQTPFHVAAANDAYYCVKELVKHIPNPNVTDRSGRTALHHAAYNGHTLICDLLIAKGCFINACDKKDFRPLHCCAQMGNRETAEFLVKFGADVNAKDRNQYTPLHVAAANGRESITRLLISARADRNSQNAFGNTPLHIACLNSNINICQLLVRFGGNVEATNFRGQTPLHIAAASTMGLDCTLFLLDKNVDINKQSLDGRTPLHMTAIHGRFTRSKMLIDKGAIIDCCDKNGSTPLHIAAQYGHDLLANTLLAYGANPSKKGYEGRTPLHMCCLSGYVECSRKFIQCGVDLNDKDDTGKTPTHCAAYKGSYECLDLLVSNGADFKIVDNIQRLPLHYAASQGHYQCIFTLVGIGSPVNAVDLEGCTPLHLAAAYDHEGKCIEYLLNHKADPKIKDNRGYTALHYATAGGNTNGVAILFNKELKMKEVTDQDKSEIKVTVNNHSVDVSPLHLAAKLGNIDILRMMIHYCSDVNVQTNQGLTPLILAAREGHAQCVHFLLRYGAIVALAEAMNMMTAVHYSAKNGHSQCLTLLLQNTEDENVVNMRDRQQRTALMLAVSGNHLECVQTLLKCGADPNIVDTDEHSCLFRAVVNGQNGIVELLLSNNAQVRTTDINGKTVLHLAAACGHFVCMQMIMSYMSKEEMQAKDKQECTALHWACYNGYADCVELLLEEKIFQKSDGNSFSPIHCATFSGSQKCLELLVNHYENTVIHLTDSRQRTPLHIAALHGHVECAKYLIERGAKVEVLDEEGRTPYVAAAQYGQTPIVELLLDFNVDLTSCDKLGNTALHWACLKKHNQTALLILRDPKNDTVISISNKDNKTPLHISARNGLVDVTRELLRKGASVLAIDNEGLTPALCCAPNLNVAQCLSLILQSLPQLKDCTGFGTELFSLSLFEQLSYRNSLENCLSPRSDFTTIKCPLSNRADFFQEESKKSLDIASITGINKNTQNVDEFIRSTQILGLNLRKSNGKLSITLPIMRNHKLRQCSECYKLQRFCPKCSLRKVLKRHLLGKSSQEDFYKFLIRCLTNSSREFKRIFNSILDEVGEELGFEQNHKQIDDKMFKKEYNKFLRTYNSKSIQKSLHIFAEYEHAEINFLLKMSQLLDNSALHYNLKKVIIKKNDATVQAVFNCSVEIQTLDNFLNGAIVLIQSVDNQDVDGSSDEDETDSILKKGKYSISDLELKMRSMGSTEFNQIAIKKKKYKSDLCNIF